MDKKEKKKHLLDLSLNELRDDLKKSDWEEFRAAQIFDWLYKKLVLSFDRMSYLPGSLRNFLSENYTVLAGKEKALRKSSDGTEKLLLEYEDGKQAETVLIPAAARMTVCLSTQSGCPVKCVFCASGQGEFKGSLSSGEIIEQILRFQLYASEQERRVTHVVLMGMGEPLLNYENTLKAVRLINSPEGAAVAARRITLSTVGLPQGIERLASEDLQITLALSLHSAWQEKRESLIPLAKSIKLEEIIASAQDYFHKTGREITLEYLMIPEVNMSSEDAEKLASISRRLRANVNLIPYNPASVPGFNSPSKEEIRRFYSNLKKLNVNVHVRQSRGRDIEAACGQLRRRND